MARARVLVVEDSPTVRGYLCAVIAASADFEVIGAAGTGREAIRMCAELRPDVVTMDMMLPEMTGLDATEQIMAHCPTPILVVSSSVNRGEVFKTYEALSAGAVDVFEKPNGEEAEGLWEAAFLMRLRVVARVRVITHVRARLANNGKTPRRELAPAPGRKRAVELIVIGASTGGPSALAQVLHALPANFDVPILIVLHLGSAFATHFAEWLTLQAGRAVGYAVEDEKLSSLRGVVRLAPPDRHLVMRGQRLHLTCTPERHSCRPSVDELFESVASDLGANAVGCLLTGMGRDGAQGLLRLRQAGAATIAQDEETSVIYGMPREAFLLGAVERVLPLQEIAPNLVSLATPGGGL
jgi:two-component system, chemotaxis family, protein-glutamate methylesterase/glutaminase